MQAKTYQTGRTRFATHPDPDLTLPNPLDFQCLTAATRTEELVVAPLPPHPQLYRSRRLVDFVTIRPGIPVSLESSQTRALSNPRV
jgi:hypothetical protein